MMDFNMVCDMETMGVSTKDMMERPFSAFRAYFACCAETSMDEAGVQINEHVINGGNLDSLGDAFRYEIEQSDFFRALGEKEEEKTGTSQNKTTAAKK